jgi:hypothetical protein
MAESTYRKGILSEPLDLDARPTRRTYPKVPAHRGLEVTHIPTEMTASVLECTDAVVVLRDDSGRDHRVRNIPGAFRISGRTVQLVTARAVKDHQRMSASGSIVLADIPARLARGSRIYVEGIHDAELIEKVWGDDLREEGVVVEPLHGVDDLAAVVRRFRPRSGRRLGILVDHYVRGTKESRLAEEIDHPEVLVRGHAFVDIWAAINPSLAGLRSWPKIPKGTPWKEAVCAKVGVPDPADFWPQLLGKVTSYRDLDPSLVGAVEELIDFVTET